MPVLRTVEEGMAVSEVFRPHAVISDVVMGEKSGIDLAVYLTEEQPECKVLLISGRAFAFEQMDEANRRGYHHSILSKPVHPERILEFLATCVPCG